MTTVSTWGGKFWRSAVALTALALAYFATTFSLSMAAARANPAVALRLFPANAHAQARRAELLIGPDMDRARWREVRALAERSLERSPASPIAMRILGLATFAAGDEPQGERFMQASRALSRRDLPTTLYMIERSVAAERPDQALANFDIALRTAPSIYDTLFPVLANALADDALFPAFDRLAARNPPWFSSFVASATYLAPPVTNVARLLRLHPNAPAAEAMEVRSVVLARLVRDGAYRQAVDYYRSLSRPGNKALVRDGGFASNSFLPPFEWAFAAEDGLAGEAAPGGGLRFSASPGSSGPVASQLLMLAPGRYELGSEAGFTFSASDGRAEWRLACAPPEGTQLSTAGFQQSPRGAGTARAVFEVPPNRCAAQTLSLIVTADINSQGIEGRVARVSMRRAEQER